MGAFVLLSSDYRIGVEGAFKLGLNEVAIGMTMPYFGVELAQWRLSKRYIIRALGNAEIFSPLSAVEAGFLDKVVDPAEIEATSIDIASQLKQLDMRAYAATKMRSRKNFLTEFDAAIAKEFS